MKFVDLTSAERSMLTMLCTGQTFDTACLGRGCNPKQDAKQAAQVLMDMRVQGLVFSSQKLAHQAYTNWRASDYGKAVFAGRPDDVKPDFPPPVVPAQPADRWVVYSGKDVSPLLTLSFYTEADAIDQAARLAEGKQDTYFVAKLVARVRPVNQPKHEIERL